MDNVHNNIQNIDDRIIPDFSGPTSKGGKIFKSTPHIINNYINMIIRTNIIIIMIFLCSLLGGLLITFLFGETKHSNIQYIGSFLTFFSFTMIVVLGISIPQNIASYNEKMSKIYLEVSPTGISGITLNEDSDYLFFDVHYKNIAEIIYNSKQISIYTFDGRFYTYDTFYNPREIYSSIIELSGDQMNLKFKTL